MVSLRRRIALTAFLLGLVQMPASSGAVTITINDFFPDFNVTIDGHLFVTSDPAAGVFIDKPDEIITVRKSEGPSGFSPRQVVVLEFLPDIVSDVIFVQSNGMELPGFNLLFHSDGSNEADFTALQPEAGIPILATPLETDLGPNGSQVPIDLGLPDLTFNLILEFDAAQVPEPATLLLLATGLLGFLGYGWRRGMQ